jgi:Protein of unknown function (DUF3551)
MYPYRETRGLQIVMAALGVIVAVGLQPSEAREPRSYCFQGGQGTTGGLLDCSYHTWAQCQAMVTGGSEGCSINPELGWRARERARDKSPGPKHPRIRQ